MTPYLLLIDFKMQLCSALMFVRKTCVAGIEVTFLCRITSNGNDTLNLNVYRDCKVEWCSVLPSPTNWRSSCYFQQGVIFSCVLLTLNGNGSRESNNLSDQNGPWWKGRFFITGRFFFKIINIIRQWIYPLKCLCFVNSENAPNRRWRNAASDLSQLDRWWHGEFRSKSVRFARLWYWRNTGNDNYHVFCRIVCNRGLSQYIL